MTPLVFDETLAREDSVVLNFPYCEMTITSYNGITVDWRRRGILVLPPGDIELTFDFAERAGDFIYTAKDVSFRYRFEAGEYTLNFVTRVDGNERWSFNIHSGKPPTMGYPRRETLVGNSPFYRQR